jgi:hypothetical protein
VVQLGYFSGMLAWHWIQTRSTGAPPALMKRVEEVLQAEPTAANGVVGSLMLAGERLLASAVAPRSGDARAAALDLLAADACVTWAFEAGAEEPGTLAARAEDAMQRIARAAETT